MISRFMSFLRSGFNIWLYLAFNGPYGTSILFLLSIKLTRVTHMQTLFVLPFGLSFN